MNIKILVPTLMILMMLMNACGSNNLGDKIKPTVTPEPTATPEPTSSPHPITYTDQEKLFVHRLFLSGYLWNKQVEKNVDFSLIRSAQAMINILRVPSDRWSSSLTSQQYENFANQKTVGFGFGFTSDFDIYFVRIGAPAYNKLFRGDKILKINGKEVSSQSIANARKNTGTLTSFTVLRDNLEVQVNIAASQYTFKVSLGKIIEKNSKKIGYLRYDSFTESSVTEFEKIFTTFKAANISELIIDLRYNGGGSIGVASILLDNITNAYPEQRQVYLDWNEDSQDENTEYTFASTDLQDGNELNMNRVVFLVTKNSASASELVISALKPYLGEESIITIGTNTHGKPVGMSGSIYGNNIYFLINFIVRNNLANTTSFNGITPTCTAKDDIAHKMGDENETMLSTALYYIENDTCL